MVLRHVAPAGAPIRLGDLFRWAGHALSSSDGGDNLRAEVTRRFGRSHLFVACTGRAAMTLLLRALQRLAPPDRDEVVLPSYTCYSVAASVIKAGLRPRIVDVSPETLDFDPDQLRSADFSQVLAVIPTNLYGLPSDMPTWSRLAAERGAFLIDDAAQSMGATVGGRWSGTWGDAGLFSLDKGKNVSAIDGGLVVSDSWPLAQALEEELRALPIPSVGTTGKHVLKALGYFAMLRPWLYGIPAHMPQLGLGRTVFTTDFPLAHADPALVALGAVMMRRLEWFTKARRENAAALIAGLRELPDVQTVAPVSGSEPVYLRLPILMRTPLLRDQAIDALTGAGVGATGSYPRALPDVPEVAKAMANPDGRFSGGRAIASRIVTLPTHPFVSRGTIETVIAELRRGAIQRCAA
ncbi:MAG TPA: DegT/DnrJ/EryC1/StrS family aminotransferase [Vicinamibacterales bacterium]|nr:DegT/DnrJ/EryC1/StrS family aminotransferase [Vicinamibacterales bacterium]